MVALNFIIPADGIAYFNMGQGITLPFIFGRIAAPAGITPKLVENRIYSVYIIYNPVASSE
jgi:hypothetical protein